MASRDRGSSRNYARGSSRTRHRAPSRGASRGREHQADNASSSGTPPTPPPPVEKPAARRHQSDAQTRRRRRGSPLRRYSDHFEKRSGKTTILLCVYHSTEHGWRTEPLSFDPRRTTDRELWMEIRRIYRTELQKEWRRIFLFQKVRHIVPIEVRERARALKDMPGHNDVEHLMQYSPSGVPIRQDPKNFAYAHEFGHSYHHASQIRTQHEWVDWFVRFKSSPDKSYGLEFVEGLWAEKLAVFAILWTVAIIVVSAVWCALGGQLQTVFTVMSFVLGGVTALIALLALYYQVTLPG